MAVLASNNPTLLDMAKAVDPDGQVAAVAELLHQTNEMLTDMVFMEGNLPTGHRHAIRTGLPTVTWRKLYGGVQPSKSNREQVTDTCGMLEAYAEIDKALADLNGNTNEFRLSESVAFIESMSQELQLTSIYGDISTAPEKFEGLATRYNDTTADNAENIINGGGTGSTNRSIWLVCWGPQTCHGIIPKGSTAGIQVNDKGQVTIENVDGNDGRMEAYRTHFRLDAGLAVKDWRYVVRIPNIDRTTLAPDPTTGGANLPNLMFEAAMMLPSMNMGNCAWYMDRFTLTRYRQQVAASTKNSTLPQENVGGVMSLVDNNGIPIRRVDALATDEAAVSFA